RVLGVSGGDALPVPPVEHFPPAGESSERLIVEMIGTGSAGELVEAGQCLVALFDAVPLLPPAEAVVTQLTDRQHPPLDRSARVEAPFCHHLEKRAVWRESEDVAETATKTVAEFAQGAGSRSDGVSSAQGAEA